MIELLFYLVWFAFWGVVCWLVHVARSLRRIARAQERLLAIAREDARERHTRWRDDEPTQVIH